MVATVIIFLFVVVTLKQKYVYDIGVRIEVYFKVNQIFEYVDDKIAN